MKHNIIKHLSRIILVILALVFTFSMMCAFTYPTTVTIDKTNATSYSFLFNGFLIDSSEFVDNIYTIEYDGVKQEDLSDDLYLYIDSGNYYICNNKGNITNEDPYMTIEDSIFPDGYYMITMSLICGGNTIDYGAFVVDGVECDTFSDESQSFRFYNQSTIETPTFEIVIDENYNADSLMQSCYILETYTPPEPTQPISDVWTGILDWFSDSMTSVMGLFYNNGALTVFGLCVSISIGIAITLLLVNKLKDMFDLR